MTLAIGIIGSGTMGKWHTYGYNRIQEFYRDVQIRKAIICSRNLPRLQKRAEELGWQECCADWMDVVSRADIDVVDISVPDAWHYTMAKAALEHGKHVICEKPLATQPEQALELMALARAKGLRCAVATNYRYLPAMQSLRRLIQEGELGEIRHIQASFTMDWAVDPNGEMNWRLDDQLCPTGALGDLGSHWIDMCHYFGLTFAEVSGVCEVYGKQRPSGDQFIETSANEICLFTARFQNDAVGMFEISRVSGGGGMAIEVHGTKGNVRWQKSNMNDLFVLFPEKQPDARAYERIPAYDILKLQYPWGDAFAQSDSFTLLFHNFLTGSGEYPTLEDGWRCCKVVQAVLQSSREKRMIRIP